MTHPVVKHSFRKTIIYWTAVVGTIILVLSTVSGVTIYNHAISAVVEEDNQKMQRMAQEIVDSFLSEAWSNITQLSSDPNIAELMSENSIKDNTLLLKVKDRILQVCTTCPFIDSIYVAFSQHDIIVTNLGYFFNYSTFVDLQWLEAVESQSEQSSSTVWLGNRDIQHLRFSETTTNIISVVLKLPFNYRNVSSKGYIVFNISTDYLKPYLSGEDNHNSSILLYNHAGSVICSPEVGVDATALVNQVLSRTAGTTNVSVGQKNYTVSTSPSSVAPDWYYLAYTDSTYIIRAGKNVIIRLLISTTALMLGGAFLIWYSSKRMYKPIQDLVHLSQGTKSVPPEPVQEFEDIKLISTGLSKALSDRENMRSLIENNRSYLTNNFIVSLLLGYLKENSSTENYLRFLKLDQLYDQRKCLVALIRQVIPDQEDGNEQSALRGILIAETIRKHASVQNFSCNIVELASGEQAVLLGLKDPNVSEGFLFSFFTRIYHEICQSPEIELTICISSVVDSLYDTPRAFRQAYDLIRFANSYNKHEVMLYSRFIETKKTDIDLPRYAKSFNNAIRSGDTRGINELMGNLHQEIEDNRLGFEQARSLLYCIYNLTAVSFSETDYSETETVRADLFGSGIDSVNQLARMIKDRFIQITEQISQDETKQAMKNAESIISYLNENYMKDISLDDVSESILYSSTYINRLLKMTTQKTFYELLTDIRINKACDLLCTSSLQISQIGEMVGYTNTQSFIRMFKKQTGLTPGQYRTTYGKKEENNPSD